MIGLMILENRIQNYAWGSKSALARLMNRPVAGDPEAELWVGAHPQAPSAVKLAGRRVTLDRLVAEHPSEMLGPVVHRFGPVLPFLLKVLAVAEPLSIQAHPSLAQAAEGFAREEAAGIGVDASNRNYRDRNHKPELAVALEPYWQLCGFRRYSEMVRHLRAVVSSSLQAAVDELQMRPTEAVLGSLMEIALQLSDRQRAELVRRAQAYAGRQLQVGDGSYSNKESQVASAAPSDATAARWVQRLSSGHPGDAGVISPYLLNLLRLDPGEGIYIGAGTLHAALQGTAVEIQANSNNVLRGGLTVKHVDVPELLRVARFAPQEPHVLRPVPGGGEERHYPTPAVEFALSTVALDKLRQEAALARTIAGPEILLFLYGDAAVTDFDGHTVNCRSGEAVFVPAAVKGYRVRGRATMFRARVPLPPDRARPIQP
ncbi:MAG: mannose-6-phosphate isomerase, class I [Spirochaetaceae bacterium]|nr:mannose-6-phosphate isomerase, class I [Spirochaetaceae bacterium]